MTLTLTISRLKRIEAIKTSLRRGHFLTPGERREARETVARLEREHRVADIARIRGLVG